MRQQGKEVGSPHVAVKVEICPTTVLQAGTPRGEKRQEVAGVHGAVGVHVAATAGIVGRQMDVRGALDKLTDDQRELVALKFIQGLSNADIAEVTGRRPGAIRALQFRALCALRDILRGK